jgi:nitrate/TMAO reductase-like tetraheme cytochrome c subunit
VLAAVAAVVLALLVGLRTSITASREGKILAFLALFLIPVVAAWLGYSEHMERATSTQFCLSCHVMGDYGKSLRIDDPSYIPARHFQNNLVPRDHACYTCHTTYTLFGTVNAKLKGVRHVMVQYFGTIPKPEDIKLYEPYQNRECLHCHRGARKFEEASPHNKMPELMSNIKSGQKSCITGGCHEFVHDVGSLKDATFWKGAQ